MQADRQTDRCSSHLRPSKMKLKAQTRLARAVKTDTRQTDRQTDTHRTCGPIRQAGRSRQTGRQAQTDRQGGRQANRQADRQTESHRQTLIAREVDRH
jgi:hypothetical protein